MAVGLDNKARQTTEVYISQPFKTLAPGGDVFAPMECTITVNGMTDDGLSVTVSPADKQMTMSAWPVKPNITPNSHLTRST